MLVSDVDLTKGRMNSAEANARRVVVAILTAGSASRARLTVMPRFKRPPAGDDNLLFSAHFAEMDEAAHIAELRRRLETDDQLYETRIGDLHQLGKALHFRKHSYLRFSYQLLLLAFVSGILITVVERVIVHTAT